MRKRDMESSGSSRRNSDSRNRIGALVHAEEASMEVASGSLRIPFRKKLIPGRQRRLPM